MPSPEDVVDHHIQAVLANDIDAVVDDYADDAVMLAIPKPIVGKDAIRALFASFPPGALPTEVSIDGMTSHGEYVYVEYHHPGGRGGDTFQVRDGKIVMQSAHIVH